MSEQLPSQPPYSEIQIDEHLILRQLQVEDAAELFTVSDENRDYLAKWLPWVDKTKKVSDSQSFIEDVLRSRQKGSSFGYGMFLNGKLVGHTSLMYMDTEEPEIGYWIAESVSGRGLTTKVAGALTDLAFGPLNLDKVIIRADPKNGGSNRVAEKLGYTNSGQRTDEDGDISNIWVRQK